MGSDLQEFYVCVVCFDENVGNGTAAQTSHSDAPQPQVLATY